MTPPADSPRTAAGRALWDDMGIASWWVPDNEPEESRGRILAIEAEAAGSEGLRTALLDVLNLRHNAFDKQGFPCTCKTHERARAALAQPEREATDAS